MKLPVARRWIYVVFLSIALFLVGVFLVGTLLPNLSPAIFYEKANEDSGRTYYFLNYIPYYSYQIKCVDNNVGTQDCLKTRFLFGFLPFWKDEFTIKWML